MVNELHSGLSGLLMTRKVIDLSLTIGADLPCSWPNAVPYRQFVDHWFEEISDPVQPMHCFNGAPYRAHGMLLDEHTGTHFDAPSHFLQTGEHGKKPIDGDEVAPSQFVGPAVVLDVRRLRYSNVQPGVSPRIEPSFVEAWENEHGALAAGDIVLFRSDWDEHYVPLSDGGEAYVTDPVVHQRGGAWPAPSPATMRLLLDRGIRCVGTDGASMGPADDGADTHVVGLSGGMVFIECLTKLAELPERGATFIFLPVKLARSTGGPGRAIAFVDDLPAAE